MIGLSTLQVDVAFPAYAKEEPSTTKLSVFLLRSWPSDQFLQVPELWDFPHNPSKIKQTQSWAPVTPGCFWVTSQPLLCIQVPCSGWPNVTISLVRNNGFLFWRFSFCSNFCFLGLWLSLDQGWFLAEQWRKQLALGTSLPFSFLHLFHSFCSILDQKDPKWAWPIPGESLGC